MKIGLFSDVHGHLDELDKTLALLKSLQVDEMLCMGDLVDKGEYSDAVIQTLREWAVPCVQGNHDAKTQYTWLTYREPLQEASLEYLSQLPQCLTYEWEGVKIYACHANPWHDPSIYVYPTRPHALFKFVADATDADVIIMGHTHQPMRVEIENTLILNPGSIYGNRDMNERTCAVLSLPDREFRLYNIDTGKPLGFGKDKPLPTMQHLMGLLL